MTTPATLSQWTGVPLGNSTVWSTLTPPTGRNLITISELGAFDLNTLAGVVINVGYNPNTVDGWSKV